MPSKKPKSEILEAVRAARTQLGKRLWAIRKKAIESGVTLLSAEQIAAVVADADEVDSSH